MRCTQEMGLNEWAKRFVRGDEFEVREEIVRVYPDGRRERLPDRTVLVSPVKCEPSGEQYHGMFEEEVYNLHRHTFPDGRVVVEKVQAKPWHSGPVIFLALQDASGNWVPESLWTEEEIVS